MKNTHSNDSIFDICIRLSILTLIIGVNESFINSAIKPFGSRHLYFNHTVLRKQIPAIVWGVPCITGELFQRLPQWVCYFPWSFDE